MNSNLENEVLLDIKNLKQYFKISGGITIKAVDDVSFKIYKGETFGLVGESGSGKTTTGRSIIKLYHPTGGEVYYKGKRISLGINTIENWYNEISRIKQENSEAIKETKKCNLVQINELKKQIQTLNKKTDLEKIKLLKEKINNLKIGSEEIVNLKAKIKEAKSDNKVKSDLRQSIQMIFQDPMASLNPRMRVLDIIAEGLDVHDLVHITNQQIKEKEGKIQEVKDKIDHLKKQLVQTRDKKLEISSNIKKLKLELKNINYIYSKKGIREQKVIELLNKVGLNIDHAWRYPHEFSGGQRQRIGIARALITRPNFIIADEPISALDVSIQAQVVNLINDLKKEFGLTYLFIAHDLSMVQYISDRIGVMHLGRLVELGSSNDISNHPIHPYTKSLLSAIPLPDPDYESERKRIHYDKSKVNYYVGKWVEVEPGHFVLGTDEEIAKWSFEK